MQCRQKEASGINLPVVDLYALSLKAAGVVLVLVLVLVLLLTRGAGFGLLEAVLFVDADLLTTRLLGLLVAVLLVDADLFTVLKRLGALFAVLLLVDVDLLAALLDWTAAVFKNTYFLGVGFALLGSRLVGDVSREGFLVFRVTFPPCLWLLCFCFYLLMHEGSDHVVLLIAFYFFARSRCFMADVDIHLPRASQFP